MALSVEDRSSVNVNALLAEFGAYDLTFSRHTVQPAISVLFAVEMEAKTAQKAARVAKLQSTSVSVEELDQVWPLAQTQAQLHEQARSEAQIEMEVNEFLSPIETEDRPEPFINPKTGKLSARGPFKKVEFVKEPTAHAKAAEQWVMIPFTVNKRQVLKVLGDEAAQLGLRSIISDVRDGTRRENSSLELSVKLSRSAMSKIEKLGGIVRDIHDVAPRNRQRQRGRQLAAA